MFAFFGFSQDAGGDWRSGEAGGFDCGRAGTAGARVYVGNSSTAVIFVACACDVMAVVLACVDSMMLVCRRHGEQEPPTSYVAAVARWLPC